MESKHQRAFTKERVTIEDTFRCRKCRVFLFSGADLGSFHAKIEPVDQCSAWYLDIDYSENDDSLDWVKEPIDKAQWTEGKIYCPKCKSRIGAFDFLHGIRCSCFSFVIPAVWIQKCKVDQISKGDTNINIRNVTDHLSPLNKLMVQSYSPLVQGIECEASGAQSLSNCELSEVQKGQDFKEKELSWPKVEVNDQKQSSLEQHVESRTSVCPLLHSTNTLQSRPHISTDDFNGMKFLSSNFIGLEEMELLDEFGGNVQMAERSATGTITPVAGTTLTCASVTSGPIPTTKFKPISNIPHKCLWECSKRRGKRGLGDDNLRLISQDDMQPVGSHLNDHQVFKEDNGSLAQGSRFNVFSENVQENVTQESDTKCEKETVEDVPPHLTCAICLDLLFDPFACGCGHIFCDPCLRLLNRKSSRTVPRCPMCRKSIAYVYPAEVTRAEIRNSHADLYRRRYKLESRAAYRRLPLPDGKPRPKRKKPPRYRNLHLPYFVIGLLVGVFACSVIGIIIVIGMCPPGRSDCVRGELE